MIPALVSGSSGTVCWNFLSLKVGQEASAAKVPACCSAHSSSAPERKGREEWSGSGPTMAGRGRRHTLVLQFAPPELCWANCMMTEPKDLAFFRGILVLGSSWKIKLRKEKQELWKERKGLERGKTEVEGRTMPCSSCTTSQLQLGNGPHLGRVVFRMLQSIWQISLQE